MTTQPPLGHGDLGPELRQLAQTLLDHIDPAVQAVAALVAARAGDEPGKCQQVWCPACALAAVVAGENHPLLGVIAEHSAGLLSMLRSVVAASEPASDSEAEAEQPQPGQATEPRATGAARYQHIPVTVEE